MEAEADSCSWCFWTLLIVGGIIVWQLISWINPFPRGYKKPSRPAVRPGEQPSYSGRPVVSRSPATGEFINEENGATREEVDAALNKAVEAQKDWGKASFEERAAFLYDLMQYVVDHQEEICSVSVLDTGKTMMEAYYGEVLTTCEKLRHLITYGADALKPESRRPPFLLMFNKSARVEYYPFGVIGIIVPWNYPVHNVISAVSAAVFTGNAAVVKVSEWSNGSRIFLERMFRGLLANRGWNPDLIQLLPGYGDTGAALCSNPKINKILFIGSPQTGKLVMSAASANLTPVILELGGKDPLIVLDDAEFDHAVDVALRGVFINQGQNCIAAERVYVQRKIYDKFKDTVQKKVLALRQGAPVPKSVISKEQFVDCGAMTMPGQVDIVDRLVADAIANGASCLAGGKRPRADGENAEHIVFYPPTLLADLDPDMNIVKNEVFGPVMLLIPFDSDDHVVEMANSTPYALGCSIFSTNYSRAEALGRRIQSGMLTINDFGLSYLIQSLPFGGCKVSGFGKFNGPEGLKEFSIQKSVVTDRFPVRTKAPRFTQYPVPAAAPMVVQNAVSLLYSGSLSKKANSLVGLVTNLIATTKE
eukprot:TRINITY_DN4364_c0_g1_i1.p1 TRINITY_DN4364_c0_g1~~TRINITY_DN4364_c0_g1_i1.p1  ORF type:complete len:625 (-),score=292.09 TRINITY_DN4364_c0_g1_i1:47-1819(-)